jgi:hypothetical protein
MIPGRRDTPNHVRRYAYGPEVPVPVVPPDWLNNITGPSFVETVVLPAALADGARPSSAMKRPPPGVTGPAPRSASVRLAVVTSTTAAECD